MENMEDMDAILDQALDDLENIETTVPNVDSTSSDYIEMPKVEVTQHGSQPQPHPANATRKDPLDPKEFLRYLIEGDEDESEEEDQKAKLDEFMRQIQRNNIQEPTEKDPKTQVSGNRDDNDGDGDGDDDVAATLASILEQMTTIDQDDVFSQEGANFNPDDVVDGMMEQLLSKDLMYEPMKQVADQFPSWLEANEGVLPETDLERYRKQYQCFQTLVQQYETDPNDINALMLMMQEVQEFGQPPQDIIKQIAPGLELDADGMPQINPLEALGDEECTIM